MPTVDDLLANLPVKPGYKSADDLLATLPWKQSGPSNAGLYDLGQKVQGATNKVLEPLSKASDVAARGASNLMLGTDKPVDAIQYGLGKLNQGIQSGVEGVTGATGYAAQKLAPPGVNQDAMKASDYAAATAGTALSMIPYVLGSGIKTEPLGIGADTAQSAGRRALGFTKRFLNRPGDIEAANATAQTMLDKGVIASPISHPFSSGTKAMIERASNVAETSGKSITNLMDTLDKQGVKTFDTNQVAQEINKQLTPEYQGGAYDAEHKIVNEIKDTVMAHGEGPIDFKGAQALKEKLQELGKFNSNTDQVKANLYRRASGIVRKALEDSVTEATLPVVQPGLKTGAPHALYAYSDNFGPEGAARKIYNVYGDPGHPVFQKTGWGSSLPKESVEANNIPVTGQQPNAKPPISAPNYVQDKTTYGRSQLALKALQNKLSSEEGNNRIGLRQAGLATGELLTGHPIMAAGTLGATEMLGRFGNSALATQANALSKMGIPPVFINAILEAQLKSQPLLGQNQ